MPEVDYLRTAPVDYLERVARSGVGRAYKSMALERLKIGTGQSVVDLGCGPGTDLADFAEATGPTGTVLGLDHDEDAVRAATRSLAASPWVVVRQADIHELDLADASVDRVHTDRVLQHVANPVGVIAEARRVLKADGRAVFAEPDYDTLVIDCPDAGAMRAYRSFVTDSVVRNSTIGRQLTRLATSAGFATTHVIPVSSVFDDVRSADEILGIGRVTQRAVSAGFLDRETADDWLNDLWTQPFFATMTLFIAVAEG
ncbi:methyltransferase domain-containing protein [Cellulomonas sp. KRMCY2]|uniref:methyltransferase domain-containing protein n=1 Tax=Cellulomonas sp. KRMCY2 TaxID=1304865 RepID=UPI00045E5BF1|nr:methyltransferase domain-containing protein [Cellulomonas sp. KRMCY2]